MVQKLVSSYFSFKVSVAVAGALPVLAYLAIPAVHQVDDLVIEEAEREVELCLTDNENKVLAADEESAFGASQVAALALFLLWKLMMGVAITTYWTLGVAYMVDAISPLVVPAALGKLLTLWQNSNTKPAQLHIKLFFKEFKACYPLQVRATWPPTSAASSATCSPPPVLASMLGGSDFPSFLFAMSCQQSCS